MRSASSQRFHLFLIDELVIKHYGDPWDEENYINTAYRILWRTSMWSNNRFDREPNSDGFNQWKTFTKMQITLKAVINKHELEIFKWCANENKTKQPTDRYGHQTIQHYPNMLVRECSLHNFDEYCEENRSILNYCIQYLILYTYTWPRIEIIFFTFFCIPFCISYMRYHIADTFYLFQTD